MFELVRNWWRRRRPSVKEYLYLDRARIASYVDQLRSPVGFEKVPKLEVGLSITGATAKAQQDRVPRAYTIFEQLAFLETTLRQSHHLESGRYPGKSQEWIDATFRTETCLARRAVLAGVKSAKIAMWISRFNPIARVGVPSTLVLFEDAGTSDEAARVYSQMSEFLDLFANAAPSLLTTNVVSRLSPQSALGGDVAQKQMCDDLVRNPIGLLERMGARIYPERCITTTYRIRYACRAALPRMIPAYLTVGYPMSIVSAESGQLDKDATMFSNDDSSADIPEDLYTEHLKIASDLLKKLDALPDKSEGIPSSPRTDFAKYRVEPRNTAPEADDSRGDR